MDESAPGVARGRVPAPSRPVRRRGPDAARRNPPRRVHFPAAPETLSVTLPMADTKCLPNLRAARKRRGLTQEQTAVAARISLAWLRLVERDPTLLSPRIAEKLFPVLGLAAPSEGTRP